ncbi:MOZ/SAS family protein [Histomonas meleagridis]|uniref:MOZ/SAS family protein n=1 Tax=Histomonas meleagridis TaxID=135588 RepID=UPI00355A2AF4|nr:MOZ/SAS family protein [Histomonas meleagridis]KAH0806211.1 MOZ/SAS family protein [Histomonas meleagridis]
MITNQTNFNLLDFVTCYCKEYQENKKAQILQFRNDNTLAYIHFEHEDKRLDRWVKTTELSPYVPTNETTEDRVLSRRDYERLHHSDEDSDGLSDGELKFEKLHKEVTKIRNIDQITIGKYTIRTWYFSPYPKPFLNATSLYICDHCFQYFLTQEDLDLHLQSGEMTPPGREIYRKDNISIFEIHGKYQKICCQCLCLLAKLFLDHKTLFYDVEGFIFYVLCECDENGAHIAAYFSREINSDAGNILACIVALPPYQKKGYGRLLISLSYEIAKRQHRSGGPERPLSDLGKIAFHSYWRDTLVELLKDHSKEMISLDDIVMMTSISRDDVIDVLREINCVSRAKGEYELMVQKDSLMDAIHKFENGRKRAKIDPMCLIWLDGDDDKTDFTKVPSC